MSQTAAARPPTQKAASRPGTGTVATSGRTGSAVASQQSQRARSTPRALRLWTLATVLACAVFALTSLLTMWNAATAGSQTADDAAQLVRVQSIRANLLRADSLATNSFLVDGLESADQRAAYDEALEETTRLLADAAASQAEDREAIASLNQAVLRYAADMEQASANDDQSYPAGGGYLSAASAELRETALPILEELASVNKQRADAQLQANNHAWFELGGLVAAVVLIAAMVWTARRFRRVFNVGLLVATLLAVLTLVIGMAVLAHNRSVSDGLSRGDLNTIATVGAMRAAANEAKVQESLLLIAEGSGQRHEQAWQAAHDEVSKGVAGSGGNLRQLWQNYADAHDKVVALDNDEEREEAVAFATGDAEDSPNATFTAFDDQARATLDAAAEDVRSSADQLFLGPLIVLGLGVPAVVAAAVFAAAGLRARLREYQ